MPVSLTYLRAHLYQIVDQVIKSGIPIEIERKGIKVKLTPVQPQKKLDRLIKHREPKAILNDPEELVHMDWSDCWQGNIDHDLP